MDKAEIKRRVQAVMLTLPTKRYVRRISLFGSHLRGNAQSGSDIDLLLEYTEPLSYFQLARAQRMLEEALKRPVDLLTPNALSHFFRDEVLAEAESIYEG